jgi:hypothetical protein
LWRLDGDEILAWDCLSHRRRVRVADALDGVGDAKPRDCPVGSALHRVDDRVEELLGRKWTRRVVDDDDVDAVAMLETASHGLGPRRAANDDEVGTFAVSVVVLGDDE